MEEIHRGTGVILTSNPRNPTGRVVANPELAEIQDICRDRATLISDEFYSGYNYTSDCDGTTISAAVGPIDGFGDVSGCVGMRLLTAEAGQRSRCRRGRRFDYRRPYEAVPLAWLAGRVDRWAKGVHQSVSLFCLAGDGFVCLANIWHSIGSCGSYRESPRRYS